VEKVPGDNTCGSQLEKKSGIYSDDGRERRENMRKYDKAPSH
jgi:hypothetical protein